MSKESSTQIEYLSVGGTKVEQRAGKGSPVNLLLVVPRRLFCFRSLVVLDIMCGYLLFFLLDKKRKYLKIDV